ncbi:MAG: Rrf2 family transcriptional regulator [Clostridia bacterium]|nr:Rrf2 family transcriptional regulator [Clostridia bacterium]MBR2323791.1 Rrf2 family transcriptional regulator [Clostridia bacterium]MBR2397943.1 Rrf2 family transcriptional regulator [Clostridia bacterium]MBR2874602.1 Rrf2 family transcriptional regulator [Clostridia bacterium]MBR6692568.1 Rrf2 family transcriptional regulator [Clostridia bacterium]
MKLSTKARYGLKAALILTKANGNIVPLSVMSKEIGVSSAYIERLMKLMKDSSIVDSARGITGGYVLKRKPEEITVGEVVRALEENLEFVSCVGNSNCEKDCDTRKVWELIYKAINDTLDGITLADASTNNF